MAEFVLDSVAGLRDAIEAFVPIILRDAAGNRQSISGFECGSYYCNRCAGYRRMRIHSDALFDSKGLLYSYVGQRFEMMWGKLGTPVPAVFRYICTQCDAAWSVFLYSSGGSIEMAIFPVHTGGGVASPNTPPGVVYYLDQAARCHGVSANSAAVG